MLGKCGLLSFHSTRTSSPNKVAFSVCEQCAIYDICLGQISGLFFVYLYFFMQTCFIVVLAVNVDIHTVRGPNKKKKGVPPPLFFLKETFLTCLPSSLEPPPFFKNFILKPLKDFLPHFYKDNPVYCIWRKITTTLVLSTQE